MNFYAKSSTSALVIRVDPPHMLKLGRNALAEISVFIDGDGGRIEWIYIERLHALQTEVGLKFANKLSESHLNFKRNKMNECAHCSPNFKQLGR